MIRFAKMIIALRKRFTSSARGKRVVPSTMDGKTNGNGRADGMHAHPDLSKTINPQHDEL
jgi:hypothetical protein